MTTIKPEIKTIIFFIVYFAIASICHNVNPGGPCTPAFGAVLFLLSIPISIIYLLILLFQLHKDESRQYLNCIYILLGIWGLIFLFLSFSN